MRDILVTEIPNTIRMDVSTGYFDVPGYGLLRGEIEAAASHPDFMLRLMLGKDSILPNKGSFETYAAQYEKQAGTDGSLASVKSSLDAEDLAHDTMANTSSLIRLLQRANTEVRMGQSRFNHSKCYIFGKNAAFIGSSNFTRAGMVGNHELNTGIYQALPIDHVQDWFDRMWEQSMDKKDEMISVLKQSKFGTPPSPYEIYMKMLFEKFKPFLKQDEHPEIKRKTANLTTFQRDAVRTVLYVINRHRGAIIADSTGLGKTNMGIEVIRRKILEEGKKVMLVAPAQVLDSMWEDKLSEVDIAVRIKVSAQKMGMGDFLENQSRYRNIDFIVIDESQNFRSRGAQRRINLMKLLTIGRPKQVLLLTATPINNSLMDLYYQLSIITGGRDDAFWRTVGIVDLYKHMRDATTKDLQQGLEAHTAASGLRDDTQNAGRSSERSIRMIR